MQNTKINFINNTIIVTKAFLAEAADPNSDACTELMRIKNDFPNMRIVTRSNGGNRKPSEYKGLTYDYMRRFIRIMDTDNLITFEDTVEHYRAFGYEGGQLYKCVRDWFLENYPHHKDMIVDTAPQKTSEKDIGGSSSKTAA